MIAIAIGLVLLILVVLLLPFLLDLNRYRDQYVPLLERAIHRKIHIQDVRLTLYPTLGVQLSEVVIADDPEFSPHSFLTVPVVQVDVQWKPLLNRRIVVDQVIAEHPHLRIIRSEQGTLNLSTLGEISPPGQTSSPQTESKDGVTPLFGFLGVKRLALIDGRVQVEDRTDHPPKGYMLEQLALNTESVAIGETAHIQVKGMVMPFQTPFELAGRVGPLQDTFDVSHITMDGHVGPVSLTAKGNMSGGQLAAEIHIPKFSTDDIPHKMALNKSIEFSQIQVHLLVPRFLENFSISLEEARIDSLHMNLQLGSSIIDFSGNGTATRFSFSGKAPAFSSDDSPVRLPIPQPVSIFQVAFTGEIREETLHLQSFTAKAFDGMLNFHGALDQWKAPRTFSTQGFLKNFSVMKLGKLVRPSAIRMNGVGELEWNLTGRFSSFAKPEIEGPARLIIRNGAIIGFNLVKVIEEALRMPGILGIPTGTTPFSQVHAITKFDKNGLAIQEFAAQASNISLRSEGRVGLDQSVAGQGQVYVPAPIAEKIIQRYPMAKVVRQEGQLVLPFVIRGTIQDPKLQLDTKLLGNQMQKKVKERLEKVLQGDEQELQNLLEDGKDLLRNFFGK